MHSYLSLDILFSHIFCCEDFAFSEHAFVIILLIDPSPFFVKDKDAEKQYKFTLQRLVSISDHCMQFNYFTLIVLVSKWIINNPFFLN